jgi:hypothetical protein
MRRATTGVVVGEGGGEGVGSGVGDAVGWGVTCGLGVAVGEGVGAGGVGVGSPPPPPQAIDDTSNTAEHVSTMNLFACIGTLLFLGNSLGGIVLCSYYTPIVQPGT